MPVPAEAEPIGRKRAREIVVERLRAWIVDGDLEPGEVIRDSEIARSLGVSRTPVREALLQLEREGLIESVPGRWTRVAPLDLEHSLDLYPVIGALEALSTRLATQGGGPFDEVEAAQRAFAAAVERFAASQDPADAGAIREADDRFHGALLRAAGNPRLADALLPLKIMTRRFENYYFGSTPEIGASSVAEHEQILAALRSGDAEGAAVLAQRNFDKSLEYFRRVLGNEPHPRTRRPEGARPEGSGGNSDRELNTLVLTPLTFQERGRG